MAYPLALALGVALAAWIFPAEFLLPAAGEAFRPVGDAAQHVIAQRYLVADAWRWPPTFAANLNTQEGGLNTAFADSIPLLALLLKMVRGWLPDGFHGIGLFYGLAWALQPVAAVWALRGADERRLLPAIGVALAAVSMPAFIGRFGHAALSGHFLILFGLGFYFRLVAEPTRGLWIGAALLQVAALLVHPYLALMTLALLAAVPATRLLRAERFLPEALGVAATVALVAAVMAAFGYLGAEGGGGYGMFAMNLLSPVWPAGSALLGWPWAPQLDATGHGGWEGYNWLGFGVIAAIVAGTLLRPGAAAEAMFRAHPGLTLAALALIALAASHRVGFGGAIILDLGEVPSFLEQFRASGRFFWPVGYALLIGAMILLARSFAPLVLVAGLIQFADAATLRGELSRWAAQHPAWTVEAPKLRDALAESRRLTVLPSWPCIDKATGDATYAQLLEVLLLASERGVPASTMYAARWHDAPRCRDRELAAAPLAPGELRVILPAAQAALAPLVPGSEARCAPLGELLACR